MRKLLNAPSVRQVTGRDSSEGTSLKCVHHVDDGTSQIVNGQGLVALGTMKPASEDNTGRQ